MRRKIILGFILLIVLGAAFVGWLFFSSDTAFREKSKYLYIRTGKTTYSDLVKTLKDSQYLRSPNAFQFLARRMDLEEKLKAGRYEIKQGMSLFDLARMLRNGRQKPVSLVITKLRTKEDLAAFIGRRFECDSLSVISYLNNADSLKRYQLDTNTAMTGVFPNTYELFWNSTPGIVFNKLFDEKDVYWTDERKKLASDRGLTPVTAYIVASIVEEETRANDEKDTMASVYLNRYRQGMRLQADPTVKFALRDFSLRRIYEKHLAVESPYNTYRYAGLPPGPICTPSLASLEAVLHSPATKYIYFVSKSDFSGRHLFSETFEEHVKKANEFRQALDKQQQIRAAREQGGARP